MKNYEVLFLGLSALGTIMFVYTRMGGYILLIVPMICVLEWKIVTSEYFGKAMDWLHKER